MPTTNSHGILRVRVYGSVPNPPTFSVAYPPTRSRSIAVFWYRGLVIPTVRTSLLRPVRQDTAMRIEFDYLYAKKQKDSVLPDGPE